VTPQTISDQTWAGIRTEFTLPTLAQVHRRLSELMEDPEPVMRQLVRVIGDGTFCPGYQFQDDGLLHPTVLVLFARAMELKIAHNYFSAWMITPSPHLEGRRPVDALGGPAPPLLRALETFGP
jgi:hypothetical protein